MPVGFVVRARPEDEQEDDDRENHIHCDDGQVHHLTHLMRVR